MNSTRGEEGADSSISLELIANNLSNDYKQLSDERILDAVSQLTHVRLDRCNLITLDGIELLNPVCITNLYLQENRLTSLENLTAFLNLRFLCLSSNRISAVCHISHLGNLKLLDLSDNLILELDFAELPKNLMILNLNGNDCIRQDGYHEKIVASLPNLKQLDGNDLSDTGDDEKNPTLENEKTFSELIGDCLLRSQSRLDEFESSCHGDELTSSRFIEHPRSLAELLSDKSLKLMSARSTISQPDFNHSLDDEQWARLIRKFTEFSLDTADLKQSETDTRRIQSSMVLRNTPPKEVIKRSRSATSTHIGVVINRKVNKSVSKIKSTPHQADGRPKHFPKKRPLPPIKTVID